MQNQARNELRNARRRLTLALLLSSASLAAVTTAGAQTRATGSTLDEVVVTATKRDETVQTVPMSVTALSADTLKEANVKSFTDFARLVPNISYSSGGEAFGRRLALRGIYGTNTVGFYIDDLPIPADLDPRVIDLERIEVLRGPQGTLFGARSMGGTIRMITKRPDTTDFSGQLTADVSTIQRGDEGYQLNGTVNIPIKEDVAALRLTAYSGREGNFIRKEFPSESNPSVLERKRVGGSEYYGLSASALVNVTDNLTVRGTFLAQRIRLNGWQLADFEPSTLRQTRLFDIPEVARQSWTYGGVTVDYKTSLGTFTSSTAYFNSKASSAEDSSETLPVFFGVPAFKGPPSLIWDPNHQLTQEFRFASTFPGPIQFVGGLYYDRSRTGFQQVIDAPGLDAMVGGFFGTDLVFFEDSRTLTTEWAPFGELTYQMNDKLSATVGLRQSWIELSSYNEQSGIASTGSIERLEGKQKALTPKVVVKYQATPDLNVYALASKGFRPGRTQTAPPIGFCGEDYAAAGLTPADLSSVDPDTLWNYETGVKSDWLGGRLRVNAAAFMIKWKNIQQSARFDCGFNFQVNAGEARSRGVELEVAATPVRGLNLSGGFGYTDAEITESASFLFTREGDPVQNVAPWTGYVSAEYNFPVTSGFDGYVRADANYVGRSFSATNDPEVPRERHPYTLVNFRAGVTNDAWEFATYVENVTDVRANLGDNSSGAAELPGRPRWQINPPRTVGLQAIRRW
ncbi:TonB-dependent receptor [Phenylobacterium sp.]|jgi:iron complex outermembrane receptor protein|uniref:TonB-dependent receptor n=1 Tax=Phenylobacterium sp. TaxID=1871053 RepID=UPI0037835AAA